MIEDDEPRRVVADALAKELDDQVRDRMTGLDEEPDSTSRLGQRLEDRFEGGQLGGYRERILSETFTSRGPGSLEKPAGASRPAPKKMFDMFLPFKEVPHLSDQRDWWRRPRQQPPER